MLFISKIAEYFNTLSKEWGAILAAPPAKVDEIEKAKILKKAIKDGTVELEELPWEILSTTGERAKPKRLKARTTKADPSDNPKKTWKAPKPKAKIVKVKSPK
jgi:hypothetical protein